MLSGIIRAALWNMSMPQILRFLAKGPRIVYIAATDGRYGGAMAVGDGIDGVGASQLYLDIKMPLAEWVHQIREFAPNMIIGYPSAVKILGELVEEGGIEIDVFRVITCGEPLGVSLRHYLEEAFRAEVINFYGASESLALGVESSAAEGMVLFWSSQRKATVVLLQRRQGFWEEMKISSGLRMEAANVSFCIR